MMKIEQFPKDVIAFYHPPTNIILYIQHFSPTRASMTRDHLVILKKGSIQMKYDVGSYLFPIKKTQTKHFFFFFLFPVIKI
jgi:hypothetical protein